MEASAQAVGRRIKAALVLAGTTSAEIAPELNVSPRTLDRTIAGDRQARPWELQRLAELLDVPSWFLERGFGANERSSDAADAEEVLAEVARALTELAQRVFQRAAHQRALGGAK